MKIVTWNINSIRIRLELVKKLIDEYKPNLISLQETKVEDKDFPEEFFNNLGYKVYFKGQKSYNGVAILSNIETSNNFCIKLVNDDSRHIAIKLQNGYELHNFYVPAGGDEPDISLNPKFKHKIDYIKAMHNWFLDNRNNKDKMILVGDLNIAPYEQDVWSSYQLRNVVSHTNIERTLLVKNLSSMHWIDTARFFTPLNQKLYSWWSYRNKDWKKSDRGRRLDHIWTSLNLKDKIKNIKFIKEARDWQKPSDHIPIMLKIL